MTIGPWQILIIGILLVLLFGKGKVSSLMGELGTGIADFKKGLKQGAETPSDHPSNSIND